MYLPLYDALLFYIMLIFYIFPFFIVISVIVIPRRKVKVTDYSDGFAEIVLGLMSCQVAIFALFISLK